MNCPKRAFSLIVGQPKRTGTDCIMKTLQLPALLAGMCFAALYSGAQTIYVPQSAPYTNDQYTVLLQHFDGTTTGTTNGSVNYTNGVFGQGVQLNTSSSYVAWSLPALSQGTVEFWANVEVLPITDACFVEAAISTASYTTFGTLVNSNDVKSQYNDVNDNWQGMTASANAYAITITPHRWHHYATTCLLQR
jgi:hypothetical protein